MADSKPSGQAQVRCLFHPHQWVCNVPEDLFFLRATSFCGRKSSKKKFYLVNLSSHISIPIYMYMHAEFFIFPVKPMNYSTV